MIKTAKVEVTLTRNNEGLWLTVEHRGRTATILLPTSNYGPLVRSIIEEWAADTLSEK